MHVNKKTIILTSILSTSIALFTGIQLLQNLESVRSTLATHIQERMLRAACCNFQTEVTACSLIPLSITCQNTSVVPVAAVTTQSMATQPPQPPWHWECKKLTFYFSWLGLLFLNKLISTVEVTDLTLYSEIDQQTLAIGEHLQKILLGNILKLPMSFKALKINSGTATLHTPTYNLTAQASFSGLSKKNRGQFKSVLYLNNGSIYYNNKPYIEHFNGTVYNLFVNKIQQEALIKASCFVRLLPTQKDLVYLTATFKNHAWNISINNQERELIAHATITQQDTKFTAALDGSLLCQALNLPIPAWTHDTIQTTAQVKLPQAQGTITAQHIPVRCDWNYANDIFTATIANTQALTNFCTLKNSPNGIRVNITLSYQQLRSLIPAEYHAMLAGDGAIHCTGTLDWPISQLDLTLQDCCLMLEQSHNICRHLQVKIIINQPAKTVYLNNIHATLFQGTIDCPRARFDFDDQWQPIYAHVPLMLQHCLFNWGNNTSTCSGMLVLSIPQKRTHIDGRLTLEDTHISSSLITQLQKHTNSTTTKTSPLSAHVTIETQKPAHIDLPGFHAKAHAQITIDGPATAPTICGTINLSKGTVALPSCTFTIVAGTVYLDPKQLDNSLLELTAKTTIEQHIITLHALGTIHSPDIRLSSTPTLSQQNIAALLIAGSTETSLNIALPALIAEHLKQLVITKTTSNSPGSPLSTLIRQLNRVKLTPKLSDPTGTSGISGGLEVEFNDHIRAKVQQNNNSTDRVGIELDYQLSDELSFKAFKDEQGQIGGQADMRFTW